MTIPRRVLPGTTYLITRRCSERRFFLRPEPIVTQVFRYALARAAALEGIELHNVIVLSNHFHAVVTDPHGNLPKFMERLDGLVARAMNAVRRRGEAFWSSEKFSAVALIGEESVWAKLVYVFCNAVRAGLVRDPLDWPGLRTTPEDMLGGRISALRPATFFRASMPDEQEVRLSVPPALAHLSNAEVLEGLKRRVDAEVKRVREKRKRAKLGWVGVRAILAQRPEDSPEGGTFPSRRTNPHLSCLTPGGFQQAKERLKEWRQRYREARAAWCSGLRETVFPKGTYWMRLAFGVRCEALPSG